MKNGSHLHVASLPGLAALFILLLTTGHAIAQNPFLNTNTAQQAAASPGKVFSAGNNETRNADLFGTQKRFVENIGQYGDSVTGRSQMGKILFGYEGLAMPVLFTEKGLIYLQQKVTGPTEEEREKLERKGKDEDDEDEKIEHINRSISMQWVNANPKPEIIAEEAAPDYCTYGMLKGKAKAYKRIIYRELYAGIDVIYSFNQNNKAGFEYSLVVKPGANLNAVQMQYGGDVKRIKKDGKGNLVIKSDIDGITESLPVSFYGDAIVNEPGAGEKFNSHFKING
ncbi:MAG TPA: hypothetical protein PLA68_16455, partial [Panacibacter sp.]|nr:hypothetical protein [Panacibacter sp.]